MPRDRPVAQQDALQLGPERAGRAVAQAEPDRGDGRPQLPLGLGDPQRLGDLGVAPHHVQPAALRPGAAAHAACSGVAGGIDQRQVHALGQVHLGQPPVVEHGERRHAAGQRDPGRHRPRVAAGAAQHGHLGAEAARLERGDQGLAAAGARRPPPPPRRGRRRRGPPGVESAAPSPRRSRTPRGGPAGGAAAAGSSGASTRVRRSAAPSRSGQRTSQAWAHWPASGGRGERVSIASRLTRGLTSPCQRSISRATTASWRSSRSRPAARSPMRKPMPRAWTPSERSRTCRCRPSPTRTGDASSTPGTTRRTGGLPRPKGARASIASAAARPRSRPPTTASTRRTRARAIAAPRALGGADQVVAEAGDRRCRELQPDRPGVASPAGERLVRGRHDRVEVDARKAAAGPLRPVALAREDDGRPLEALGQARGHDAHHALVPPVARPPG